MAVPVYMGLIRLIYLSLQEIEVGGYEIRGTPSSELAFSTSRVRSIVPVIQFHIEIRYLARYTFCHCWIRFPFSRFRDQIIRTGNLQLFTWCDGIRCCDDTGRIHIARSARISR